MGSRLTLPPIEPGMRAVMVSGRQVGHAVTVWDVRDEWNGAWQVRLWEAPGRRDTQLGPEPGTWLYLADMRQALRDRLDEEGPWWTDDDR